MSEPEWKPVEVENLLNTDEGTHTREPEEEKPLETGRKALFSDVERLAKAVARQGRLLREVMVLLKYAEFPHSMPCPRGCTEPEGGYRRLEWPLSKAPGDYDNVPTCPECGWPNG